MSTRYSHKGFTLIELMIVITIIGIMAGLIGLSVFTGDPSKEAQKEAKRFIAVMTMALDESAFNQQDLGIYLEEEGYSFLVWGEAAGGGTEDEESDSEEEEADEPEVADSSQSKTNNSAAKPKPTWQYLTGEPSLAQYELPEEIRLEIEIEDSELLGEEGESDTELTRTNLNLDEIGPKVEEAESLEPPHVYILSSGELAPSFRLGFYHVDKPDTVFYITGDEMGRVDFEREEDFYDDE
ncbi:MAG: prepilin-type N-terminal cleavage/methylation domain-containing protein [Pseudomonadales bacterium]|nr:prepilin-type N-terminal cleavage/methylation domain-containing protein [Pseudomonadales bacterium]